MAKIEKKVYNTTVWNIILLFEISFLIAANNSL
jgi:hypothetical protein